MRLAKSHVNEPQHKAIQKSFLVFKISDIDCAATLEPNLFRSVAFSTGHWSTGVVP